MSGDLSVFTTGADCQMLGAEREKPWEELRSQEESFPPWSQSTSQGWKDILLSRSEGLSRDFPGA